MKTIEFVIEANGFSWCNIYFIHVENNTLKHHTSHNSIRNGNDNSQRKSNFVMSMIS